LSEGDFSISAAQSRLRFAGAAILAGVRERNRKWTWEYFAERRDDRNKYVELFQKKILKTLSAPASPVSLVGFLFL
jgi:vacuolar protein sorting-associated protein 13A/C